MKTDTFITICVAMMVNAVIFGIGAITVLSVPMLNENAKYLLPAVVVLAFAIAPFIAWQIAPRLRLRYWRERGKLGPVEA
ncbi:hypothetical protein HHL25_07120 [Rhizobium sp. S-51]|uniref:Uncharacterized protein n=1 Tax=Rhizobium terricola TaxID=2728849 RepID=A0A7Y0AUT5_9HYPH|nr:hypothetical protein [Rhizobium terricola]NML73893.1 hypothetical protein [Rhizobium terricola]